MKSCHAFTIMEMLWVSIIIATLTAIAIPSFQSARMQAWKVASASNLRQLCMANVTYAADNGRFAPVDNRTNLKRWCGGRTSISAPYDPTKGYLADYLGKSRRVTPCPLFSQMLKKNKTYTFEEGSGGYGYNDVYIGGLPLPPYALSLMFNSGTGERNTPPTIRVAHPSTTVMFTTTAYAVPGGVAEYPFSHPPFWDFGSGPSGERPSPSVHFRFNGYAIAGWCDGHVSFEKRDLRPEGYNPHGGNATYEDLGWFGPDDNNGYWNPQNEAL